VHCIKPAICIWVILTVRSKTFHTVNLARSHSKFYSAYILVYGVLVYGVLEYGVLEYGGTQGLRAVKGAARLLGC
jgi:hypothetical protein